MAMIHLLEDFVGHIKFDRVAHHKVFGSIIRPPSSTAAYLINTSRYNGEAEVYLKYVIKSAARKGKGGAPSVYPFTHFEYFWVCRFTGHGVSLKHSVGY